VVVRVLLYRLLSHCFTVAKVFWVVARWSELKSVNLKIKAVKEVLDQTVQDPF